MAATIKDVAKLAGVSKAAVSYVLNGRETSIKIAEETRQRIFAAARALNYHPNALARALSQKRTDTVALVMQFPAIFSGWSGFTLEMMRGAAETAVRLGFDLMLHTKEQTSLTDEVAALTDGRVDGALLLRDYDDPLASLLTDRGFPCVVIFGRSEFPNVWYVDCDDFAGGRIATEYLINLGHRRILHLAGTPHSSAAADRRAGYRQAMADHGIQVPSEWEIEVTHAGASYEPVEAALLGPEPPTAVFAWSDEVAVRLMTLARGLGLSIPEDLSVVGFDSTELCNHTNPPLTSVRQPIYEMAGRAFELLVQKIRNEPVETTQVIYTPVLDIRGSCAAPRSTPSHPKGGDRYAS